MEDVVDLDVKKVYKKKLCSNIENVISYDSKTWLKERPNQLVNLLETLCKLDSNDNQSAFLIAKCIEQIYSCRNKHLILPNAFRQNLLTYSLSNSKLLVNFNAATTPAGSYSFLKKWLSELSNEEIKVPSGDVRIVFDNEQVVGKIYRVKAEENKVPLSVITSHAYLKISKTSNLQYDSKLKPKYWMFNTLSQEQKLYFLAYPSKHNSYFRSTRNDLVASRITELVKQQNVSKNQITDFIDDLINAKVSSTLYKECVDCGGANDATYRVCRNCKGPLKVPVVPIKYPNEMSDGKYDAYKHFNFPINTNDVEVHVGEPDFLNPNSFQNIATILDNIGKRAEINKYCPSGKRQWLFMENDGGILCVLLKLVFNVVRCEECKSVIYGIENFKEHSCKVLNNAAYTYEFDWIVPQTGLLHLEMNSGKAFMNCNWDVFMKDVCEELGFKSENSLKYIKKGSDHHKLWQILEITYLAITDELLLPYIRQSLNTGAIPCVAGYWEFSNNVLSPSFDYAEQCALTYLHAMMLLRKGIRSGHSKSVFSAKSKLALLFFGRNHPKYQKLLVQDFKIDCRMPEETKCLMSDTLSFGRHGHDAVIEEINKAAKKWVIGVPTNIQWKRSLRNLDKMDKVTCISLFSRFLFIMNIT